MATDTTLDPKGDSSWYYANHLWSSRFLMEDAKHQRDTPGIQHDDDKDEVVPLWRQVRQQSAETKRFVHAVSDYSEALNQTVAMPMQGTHQRSHR